MKERKYLVYAPYLILDRRKSQSQSRFQAPFTPKLPDLSELWHKGALPMLGHAPGITIAEPCLDLMHDDRFPANPLF
jgi:hypothetical protein